MILNYPSANDPNGVWEIKGGCDVAESYRTNPIITGSGTYTVSSNSKSVEITGIVLPSNPQNRYAWYIVTDNHGRQALTTSGTQSFGIKFKANGGSEQTEGQLPCSAYNYTYQTSIDATFETNIPIFDTSEHKEAYVTAQTDEEALAILNQYCVNKNINIFIGCIGLLPPEPPAPAIDYKNYAYFDGTLAIMEVPSTIFETDINSDWTVEVVFYDTRLHASAEKFVVDIGNERAYCRKRYGSYYAISGSQTSTMTASASEGEHTAIINDNRKCYIDNTYIGDWIPYGSSTDVGNTLHIGGRGDGGQLWDEYIKKVKVTKNSTGDVICEYKPAIIDNEACFYDEINDSKLTTTGLTVMDTIPS